MDPREACEDEDLSEMMGLYLFFNILPGKAEACSTRKMQGSDVGRGRGNLTTFPAEVNWLQLTHEEAHASGLAQDKFRPATRADNEGVDAFGERP